MTALHPSQVLREKYLAPRKMTSAALGRALGVSRSAAHRLAAGKSGVSPESALRLGRAFGTPPEFWTRLQNEYNVSVVEPKIRHILDKIEPVVAGGSRGES